MWHILLVMISGAEDGLRFFCSVFLVYFYNYFLSLLISSERMRRENPQQGPIPCSSQPWIMGTHMPSVLKKFFRCEPGTLPYGSALQSTVFYYCVTVQSWTKFLNNLKGYVFTLMCIITGLPNL